MLETIQEMRAIEEAIDSIVRPFHQEFNNRLKSMREEVVLPIEITQEIVLHPPVPGRRPT